MNPILQIENLLIPPLTAHLFARTMRQFMILAAMIGGVSAFIGFWLAYQWDLPVGPTEVVLLVVVYFLGFLLKKIFHRRAGG